MSKCLWDYILLAGSNHKDHDMLLSLVPIHKVTHEPQLPAEFLNLPIDL